MSVDDPKVREAIDMITGSHEANIREQLPYFYRGATCVCGEYYRLIDTLNGEFACAECRRVETFGEYKDRVENDREALLERQMQRVRFSPPPWKREMP